MNTLSLNVPEFLYDDHWVAFQTHLVRRWLPAKVYPYPVVTPDRPWERRVLAMYGSVLPRPGGGYRMYYSNHAPAVEHSKVFLAESEDGFTWIKPEVGQVEWQGSRANNIVVASEWISDSPSAIYEPDDPEAPYKLLFFEMRATESWGTGWGLYGYVSPDGYRWSQLPGVRLRAGDHSNLMASRPGGRYVVYTRHPEMGVLVGSRAIYRSESLDFQCWSQPELVLAPDLQDEPDVELYGMSVFQRHGWFIGLLEHWNGGTDTMEVHLAVSRDGMAWQRSCRLPFIAAAYDWNRRWNSCASNGPIIVKEQMVFYFGGRWTSHHYDSAQQYGAIGYASLPLDRFCALEGGSGGRFETPPTVWPGGDLVLNADTRESFTSHPMNLTGSIDVEVLDAEGRPWPAWSGELKASFRSNTHCRCRVFNPTVRWPNAKSLDELKGQPIRLRFWLRHARLYTFAAVTA
jgi:hypothetical protein